MTALLRRPQGRGVHVVRDLDRSAWEAFVTAHPSASIFHTPSMHEVFARTARHRPLLWAALDRAGGVAGLMTPVDVTTLGGPLRPLATRTVLFDTPLVAPGAHRAVVLRALLASYRREHASASLFTEIRHLAPPGDLAGELARAGFRHEPHLNFLVDLERSEQQLWQPVAASARRNVRRARRMGVEVREARDHADVAEGYAVLRDAYRRIRVPLPDRSLFDACFDVLAPGGSFTLLLATLEGRAVGVLALLRHAGRALYWYTGSERTDPPCRASDLLAWHAITDSRAAGCRVLDFGGAGRPGEPYGVRDFKAKYGGRLVGFGRDVWTSAPVRLRLSRAGYAVARRWL